MGHELYPALASPPSFAGATVEVANDQGFATSLFLWQHALLPPNTLQFWASQVHQGEHWRAHHHQPK